jgi:hypothetical protein
MQLTDSGGPFHLDDKQLFVFPRAQQPRPTCDTAIPDADSNKNKFKFYFAPWRLVDLASDVKAKVNIGFQVRVRVRVRDQKLTACASLVTDQQLN